MAIIMISNELLFSNSIPKNGKLVRKRGSKAQWIAQASEAVIPNPSQLILLRIREQM